MEEDVNFYLLENEYPAPAGQSRSELTAKTTKK
jgi:hypothetical protein